MSGHFATIFHTGTRCCAAAIVLVVAMSTGTWACGARGRAPLSEVRWGFDGARERASIVRNRAGWTTGHVCRDLRRAVSPVGPRSQHGQRAPTTRLCRRVGAVLVAGQPCDRLLCGRPTQVDRNCDQFHSDHCECRAEVAAAHGTPAVILYTPNDTSGLVRVSAAGGDPMPLTSLGPGMLSHRYPEWLPDGRRFLFFCAAADGNHGVYLGSVDNAAIQR